MVQRKLTYVDLNGRKRRQSSTMLNFQGQRKFTLAFQPISKAPQCHWVPTHCCATVTHGHIRWPVYTSMHGVICAGIHLLLLCNVYAQRGHLGPLIDARSINPALWRKVFDICVHRIFSNELCHLASMDFELFHPIYSCGCEYPSLP